MAVIKGITVYIPLYDKWGNSIGQIELEPRLVDGLPKRGSRKGELVFNTQDSKLYVWTGSEWSNLKDADTLQGEPPSAFTHARNGGKNIWVQSEEPTAIEVGDIWIQTE